MTWARIGTAAVLIPAVVAIVWYGSTGLVAAMAGLAVVLALLEFIAMGEPVGLHGYRLWTSVCALGVMFQQWTMTERQSWTLSDSLRVTRGPTAAEVPLELVLLVFVLGAAAIIFMSQRPLSEALGDLSLSSAGLIFVVLPFSAVVRLDGIPEIGPGLLLFVLALAWAGDTAAYFVGRAFGRLRMAPQLSPKKTWEGAAANLLGSLMVGVAFARWLQIDARDMVVMAAAGNIAGQAGDLLKSAYKRSAGVKDSGTLLPGHGGMLDRVDSLILAAPTVWYYFQMVLSSRR